jgi:hypothetical protein
MIKRTPKVKKAMSEAIMAAVSCLEHPDMPTLSGDFKHIPTLSGDY